MYIIPFKLDSYQKLEKLDSFHQVRPAHVIDIDMILHTVFMMIVDLKKLMRLNQYIIGSKDA